MTPEAASGAAPAGYQRILIHPHPPVNRCLTWAKAGYDSIHGRIESSWKIEGEQFILDILIPANTTARVVLPAASAQAVTEAGQVLTNVPGISATTIENGHVICEVGSGRYQFACPLA